MPTRTPMPTPASTAESPGSGTPGTAGGALVATPSDDPSAGSTADPPTPDGTDLAIPVQDATPSGLPSRIEVLPLVGSMACFTAAGVGAVVLRRRRTLPR